MSDPAISQIDIVVHAPFRHDGDVLQAALQKFAHKTTRYFNDADRNGVTISDTSIVVCTQEGLTESFLQRLTDVVDNQPSWAQLPVLVILDHSVDETSIRTALGRLFEHGLVTVLHRPIRALEFNTALASVIAARKRQLEIKDYLDLQDELKSELNHRIKNTFATVYALYQVSLRQSQDLEDFDARFSDRLNALSSIQDLLRESENTERSVLEIAAVVLAPYQVPERQRIFVSGDTVTLSRQPAQTIALIFNELATNAAKYGALSTQTGSVNLEMKVGPGNFEIVWCEQGGPGVVEPSRTSYGTRFIKASSAALGGQATFDYSPSGLVCRIDLKPALLG